MKTPLCKTDPILASVWEAAMTVGEKIQGLRATKGWSQEDLAVKLGTKPPQVSRWENNHSLPSTENIRDLGKLFGVSLDYLLYEETPFKPLVGFSDPELVAQFTAMDQLDESARAALKRFIRALSAEKKVRELAEAS